MRFWEKAVRQILHQLAGLSFNSLHKLSYLLYLVSWYVLGYRKKIILQNLKIAFPDKTDKQRRQIAQAFVRNFADTLLETLKVLNISLEELQQRVEFHAPPELQAHFSNRKNVALMVGHLGSWELIAQSVGYNVPHKVLGVYKPLSSKLANSLMIDLRSRFGGVPIPMRQTLRQLDQYNETPIMLGLLADQSPSSAKQTQWVNFFGRPTPFYNGGEKLARRFKMPVYYGYIERKGKGYYRFRLQVLALNAALLPEGLLMRHFAERLENNINKQPANWLWSHRRWKHAPPSETENNA